MASRATPAEQSPNDAHGDGDSRRTVSSTEIDEILTGRLATLAVSVVAGLTEIGHSLEALADELAPLRQLVPATTTTDADSGAIDAIESIRQASQAPTWEHVSTLGIPTWSIPSTGAAAPAGRSEGSTYQLVPVPNDRVAAVYRLLADLEDAGARSSE